LAGLIRLDLAAKWAMIGIFVILSFSVIAAARDFLMPVTASALLFFVFTPFRRWLYRHDIPQWVSAVIVVFGLLMLFALIVLVMLGPASKLIDSAPSFAYTIEQKLDALTGPLHRLQYLASRVDAITGGTGAAGAAAPQGEGSTFVHALVAMAPMLVGQVIFVLVLLFFMMSTGDLLYLKVVQSFPTMGSKRQAYAALREIEDSLGSYFSTITMINAGLGVAIGLTMWAFGMPAPAFLGLAAFLLNFIPYLGAIAGASAVFVIGLVSLDGFSSGFLVAASYVALTAIEGQFITPTLISRRLEMNPVVVFLAVALWAWLWTVVGMIVAVPLLVVTRVMCDKVPGLERLGNFLGGEDPPPLASEAEDAAERTVAPEPAG
jgi:predicted PurR-regulated permease PerM